MNANKLNEYLNNREKEYGINLFCVVIHEEVPEWLERWHESHKESVIPFPENNHGIAYQSAYVKKLVSERKRDNDNRRRVIFTRAPFIITDFDCHAVFIVEGNKISTPEYQTFGSSANRITMKMFQHRNTIGDLASTKLKRDLGRAEKMTIEQINKLIDSLSNSYGDSVEKIIAINNLLNKIDDLEGKPHEKDL